jgi:hypothetical protein
LTSRVWRRRANLVAAMMMVAGVVGFVTVPARTAQAQVGVVGLADASGIRVTFTIPNYLVLTTIADGGGPVAQSTLDTSGNADGYASMPYPGNTAVTAPGLLSVLLGTSVPFSYPLYVEATAPLTPTAHAQDATGTLSMGATASPTSATGTAQLVPSAGSLQPTGTITTTAVKLADDGVITATADSVVEGLDLANGLLRIGKVHTHAVTTFAQGDQRPKTVSTTTVEGATVAGLPIGIDARGAYVLGQPVGNPLSVLTTTVNSALKAAGIAIKVASVTPITGGEQVSGLEIDSTEIIPVAGNPKGTIVYLLGGTTTSVVLGGAGAPVVNAVPPSPAASGDSVGPATGSTAPLVPSTGSLGVPTSGSLAVPRASAPAQSALPAAGHVVPILLARDLRHTWRVFYIILMIGGAFGLATSALWRSKGVRATWIS